MGKVPWVISKVNDGSGSKEGCRRRWTRAEALEQTTPAVGNEGETLSWYVFWPCAFAIFNLLAPRFLSDPMLKIGTLFSNTLELIFIGILVMQIGWLAIATVFGRFPYRLGIPVSFGWLGLLGLAYMAGIQKMLSIECFEAGGIALGLAIVILHSFWMWYPVQLVWESPRMRAAAKERTSQHQFGVHHLLLVMVLVAIICSAIRITDLSLKLLYKTETWHTIVLFASFLGSLSVVLAHARLIGMTLRRVHTVR